MSLRAAAGSWLLEPAERTGEPGAVALAPPRQVIAVFGLARGCGVTVVARALAAELARRDSAESAAVHCDACTGGIPLATPAAGELARMLAELPGADARALGRICLVGGADCGAVSQAVRELAPLVLDAGSSLLGGAPAALADRVLLVASPWVEPALAAVAADCLGRLGHSPLLVLNRAVAGDERAGIWAPCGVHPLPESRMGAQLALGGREARGKLGRSIGELADLCEVRAAPDWT